MDAMRATGILPILVIVLLHQPRSITSITAEQCGVSAEIGSPYSLTVTGTDLKEPFQWEVVGEDRTQTLTPVPCDPGGVCPGTPEYNDAWYYQDPDIYYSSITFPGNGSSYEYESTLALESVSTADNGLTLRWSENGTNLGECRLEVYSFQSPPTCSAIQLTNSTTDIRWICRVNNVYPQILALVEVLPIHTTNKTITSSHPVTLTCEMRDSVTGDLLDGQCVLETSLTSLDTGEYRLRMSVYPNITDGWAMQKTIQSEEFIVVKHTSTEVKVEESDDLDIGVIAGIVVAVVLVFSIGFWLFGYLVGKRRSTRKQEVDDRGGEGVKGHGDYDGLALKEVKTTDQKDTDGTQPNAYQSIDNMTSASQPPKQQKQKQQQQQQQQQQHQQQQELYSEGTSKSNNIYVNQIKLSAQSQNAPEQIYEQPPSPENENGNQSKNENRPHFYQNVPKNDYQHPKNNKKRSIFGKTEEDPSKKMTTTPRKALVPSKAAQQQIKNSKRGPGNEEDHHAYEFEDTQGSVYEMPANTLESDSQYPQDEYLVPDVSDSMSHTLGASAQQKPGQNWKTHEPTSNNDNNNNNNNNMAYHEEESSPEDFYELPVLNTTRSNAENEAVYFNT